MRRLLAAVSVAALASACSASSSTDADAKRPGDRTERVQQVLDDLGALGAGELDGGTFEFSSQIDDGRGGGPDRLASTSWDVYYVLDDGGNGSWGAGLDVFGSPAEAERITDDGAGFFCPGERRDVAGLDLDVDDRWAYSCARPTGGGFYATLDAVEGSVAANLTVTGTTRAAAEAALAAVGAVLVDALGEASADLDDGS